MKRRAIIKPGHLTRQDWAKRISSQWKDACDGMLEAIFNVGRDLIEAIEALRAANRPRTVEVRS